MARLQGRLGAGRSHEGRASTSTRCARSSGAFSRPSSRAAESPLPALDRPASVPADWEDHVKLMFDLQVLALQADLTRVITFQLAREGSTRTYPQIGVPEPHHPVSHHANDPEKLAKLAKINAYHVSLFAYLLEKLRSTPDGDGTLLDHSTYLLGSGMGNPDIHDHREPADRRRARRHRRRQGRPSRQVSGRDAAGQPAPDAARRRGRAPRQLRRQHRPGRRHLPSRCRCETGRPLDACVALG